MMAAILQPPPPPPSIPANNFIVPQNSSFRAIYLEPNMVYNNNNHYHHRMEDEMKMIQSPVSTPSPTPGQIQQSSSPYYLYTVTCCESERCFETSPLPPPPVPPTSPNSNGKSNLKSPKNNKTFSYDDCEYCRDRTSNKTILWADSPSGRNSADSGTQRKTGVYDPALYFEKQTRQSAAVKVIPKLKIDPISATGNKKKNSINLSSPENHSKSPRLLSPEISSPSPVGTNGVNNCNSSSGTEYTEIPGSSVAIVNHNNSASVITRNYSPSILDYRLFFINDAQKHGFFRKAVPTLPLAFAVMFCIMNLVLPGSGTFMASVAIVFGSQTEYGPGCGCQAFFICFLSAILQFLTAIVVFGWVWSIMWGIVFIKNSLRYGQKRDIHTISLC